MGYLSLEFNQFHNNSKNTLKTGKNNSKLALNFKNFKFSLKYFFMRKKLIFHFCEFVVFKNQSII